VKRCTACHTEKPLSDFYLVLSRGHKRPRAKCKSCERAYQAAQHSGHCRPKILDRMKRYARTVLGRFNVARSVARRRNLVWSLTLDEYAELLSRPCAYCGGALNSTGAGLDRKDSAVGYTTENVAPCCRVCNLVKSDIFTAREMLLLGRCIRDIMNARTQPPHVETP